MAFFGVKLSDKVISDNKLKVRKEPSTVCSDGKGKCRGELPFKCADMTVWLYIYEKGEPDIGQPKTKFTTTFKHNDYCWVE